jgi:mannan endo-1,4-beta-mannosidase
LLHLRFVARSSSRVRLSRICSLFVALLGASVALGSDAPTLVDSAATPETVALFRHLRELTGKNILFGHQAATTYGHGWSGDPDRSDVKSVVGSHPAVVGEDFGSLTGFPPEEIAAARAVLQKQIIATYDRGGVTTASWHMVNPVTPATSYGWKRGESAAAVSAILPGGTHHEEYRQILAAAADLAHAVKGADGTLAPVIFRPFHEFDGDWFWWGRAHCTREEFVALWRFTVSCLRDELQVHNFLYAFSPDVKFDTEAGFLDRYPGDAWVDLVGVDDYADFGRNGRYNLDGAIRRLRIVSAYAQKSGKLAALTETGLESIPNDTWWTGSLLKVLKTGGLKLAYVLVWRNDDKSPTHYYAPFPGHASAPDFVKFHEDPFTVFETDLRGLYRPD